MSSKYYRLDSEHNSNTLMTRSEFRKETQHTNTSSNRIIRKSEIFVSTAIINQQAVSAAVCYLMCLGVLSRLFPMFFYAPMPGPRRVQSHKRMARIFVRATPSIECSSSKSAIHY